MGPVDTLLLALAVYLAIGAIFAVYFAAAGARRLDPAAASGSLGFRLIVLPAAAMLWPALAIMCLRARKEPGA